VCAARGVDGCKWDQRFESPSLQRGVCKPSVPRERASSGGGPSIALPRYTPAGRRIAVCPATYSDATCKTRGACARVRDAVIGFPAHGAWRQVEAAIAARDVPAGASWAFRDHRSMAEVVAEEAGALSRRTPRSASSNLWSSRRARTTPDPICWSTAICGIRRRRSGRGAAIRGALDRLRWRRPIPSPPVFSEHQLRYARIRPGRTGERDSSPADA
jgi:hypothetical protein